MVDEIALAQLLSLAEAESHETVTLGQIVGEAVDLLQSRVKRLQTLAEVSTDLLERLKEDVQRSQVDLSVDAD